MIKVQLADGNGRPARFNPQGQLETALGDYDLSKFVSMSATATAFNYYTPIPGRQFLITGLLCFATKDVQDNSDTNIVIYEGTTPSTTTEARIILQFGMGQLTVLSMPNLRLLVSQSVFLNAKTDDATVDLNILGHFIPTVIKTIKSSLGIAP